MTRGLSVSTFVDITTAIAAGGVLRQDFGLGLLVTTDEKMDAGGPRKIRIFRDLEAVDAVFGASDDVRKAAAVWFAADPPPKSLYIGRWATSDVSTTLTGGAPTATIGDLQSSAASFTVTIAGTERTVTADTQTDGTNTAVAGSLSTALAALVTGATVTFSTDNRFVITLSDGSEIGYASGGIAADLGLTQAAGAAILRGGDEESVTAAIAAMLPYATSGAPVALMLSDDCPASHTIGSNDPVDTRTAMSSVAQAGDYVFGLLDTADAALATNDGASASALAFGRGQSHVQSVYSAPGQKPEVGLLAMLSAQNLNSPQSIITPHLKSIPGVEPTVVTDAQRAELERKRVNVYTYVGGLGSLVGGWTERPGSWLDAVWWLLWLKNEMELAIFNAQRASRRFDTDILADTIGGVLVTAERSGGIEPGGRVNASIRNDIRETFDLQDFDGILTTGYMTWIETPAVRSDVDRENRIGRFKVWIAPADAIHKVTGDIVLSG